MRELILLCCLGAGLFVDALPSFATEDEERHRRGTTHQLSESVPPLHPEGILVASNPKGSPAATAVPGGSSDSRVPPSDTESVDDQVDDTQLESEVDPHVEEDSAGALDDMGDVGGDFEE